MSDNTHFVFRHKAFNVDGGYFSGGRGGGEVRFNMPMGEVMASVPLDTLCREFDIAGHSEDGQLLNLVRRALHHVETVRVNDAIPSELLDGTASWSVEERHRLAASCRLAYQLVTRILGDEAQIASLAEFQRRIDDPDMRVKIQQAIHTIADELGIADAPVATIERHMDTLAHELAYLEALRERFQAIQALAGSVERAAAGDHSQRVREESERVLALLSMACKRIGSEFDLMVKQCEDITRLLADVEANVGLIRTIRDEIRGELAAWDAVLDDWQAYDTAHRKPSAAPVIERTYRFLATNYPIGQVW